MRLAFTRLLFVLALSVWATTLPADEKLIVGATEVIEVVEANLSFLARVDTGAESCSIHAVDIKVDPSGNARGKPISFRIENQDGQSRQIDALIDSVVKVKSAGGSERRYKVPLTLKWNNTNKTVLVTLSDRHKMTYRLLLGRNWLHGDYLVDVERNSDD